MTESKGNKSIHRLELSGSTGPGGGGGWGAAAPLVPPSLATALILYISVVFSFSFSLHELVKHEENGLIFHDSLELAQQLKVCFMNLAPSVTVFLPAVV